LYPPTGLPLKGQIKNTVTLTSADSGEYSKIDLGNSETITVDSGDVLLYVTGDIDVDNSGGFTVNTGATLTLYVDGDFESKNGAEFNVLSGVPSNFTIYGTGDDGQQIDINAKNDLYGVIYAPNADISIYAGGDIFGSFIGVSFESKSKSVFSYDTELGEVGINTEGVYFAIMDWREE